VTSSRGDGGRPPPPPSLPGVVQHPPVAMATGIFPPGDGTWGGGLWGGISGTPELSTWPDSLGQFITVTGETAAGGTLKTPSEPVHGSHHSPSSQSK
jgi:hypothetical protein